MYKKGDKGYMVGYWNTRDNSIEMPKGGTMVMAITAVTVKSCGKKQMTVYHSNDERMGGHFYSPDSIIYDTVEEAEVQAKQLFQEWLKGSEVATKRAIEESFGQQYSWYKGRQEEYRAFLRKIMNDQIPFGTIIR